MAKTRRLEIEIVGDARKGDKAFKGIERRADRFGDNMRASGREAGNKFADGVESGMDGIDGKAADVGDSAGESFGSGFDIRGVGGKITSGFGGIASKLAVVAGGAGAAAGGALVVGLMGALEKENTTDRLAAQLGGGKWAESMGDVAGNLYADAFGESIAETGAAVRQVVQRNLLPEDATADAVEGLTSQFLTFTDVMEQDMDMATQAVGRMIRSGIAEDGTDALDILTRGIQTGADNAGDLLETFQEYSTMFRELGISAEDATGLMVQGLDAGARDADKVADALKELAIRAKDGSDASAEGFKEIGLNAGDMTAAFAEGGDAAKEGLDKVLDGLRAIEDPVKRDEAAVKLFGTQAEDLGDALFALDLDTAADELGNVAGATDEMASAYDNAQTNIESFKRKGMQALTEFVGNNVLPALEDAAAWVQTNWPQVRDTIMETLQPALDWAKANWPGFRDAVVGAFNAVVGWVRANWPGFREAVMGAFNAIKEWVDRNWPGIRDTIVNAITIVAAVVGATVAVIQQIWDQWGANILAAVRIVWNTIRSHIQLALGVIRGVIQTVSALIRGDWSAAWDGIKLILSSAWNFIKAQVRLAIDTVKLILSAAWNSIKTTASTVWNGIKTAIMTPVNAVKSAVPAAIRGLRDTLAGIWNTVKSKVASIWRDGPGSVKGLINGVVDGFFSLPSKVRGIFSSVWAAIKSGLASAVNWVVDKLNIAIGALNSLIDAANKIPKVNIPNISEIPKVGTGGGGQGTVATADLRGEGLAHGGVVPATPGGVLKRISEGGRDEAVIPLPRGFDMADMAGGTVINISMAGAIVASEAEAERWLTAVLARASAKGRPITLRGRSL